VKTSWCALLLVIGSSGIASSEEEIEPVDPQAPITNLDGDSPRRLAGSTVYLDDVPIRAKSGNGMWVGYTSQRRIFVAPIDPSSLNFVTVGTRVDIHGTAREAPNASLATKVFAVDGSTARRLGGDNLYIDAWSLTVD
jgi:hypothetical protein